MEDILKRVCNQPSFGAPLTSIVGKKKYYGSQWCPRTALFPTFFRISSFVFSRTKTFVQIWNYLRVSKWQNFHFWVNYPFKTFTDVTLAQSLHVACVWYPLARLHGLKQKYFQHCDVTNYPVPNVPNRTVTPLCHIEPNRKFFEPLHPYIFNIYRIFFLSHWPQTFEQ